MLRTRDTTLPNTGEKLYEKMIYDLKFRWSCCYLCVFYSEPASSPAGSLVEVIAVRGNCYCWTMFFEYPCELWNFLHLLRSTTELHP